MHNLVSTVRTSKKAVITAQAIIKRLGSLSESDFNAVMVLYDSLPD